MLKPIQEIRQVGCFEEDRPASVEFDRLTFLFGENCYGKSTLCDVLRSVGENRPEYIVERLSVPRGARRDQRVRLSFLPRGAENEACVSFGAGRWSSGLPGPMRLHVFDTEFIHRNVFTGLSVERRNQENITRFVLGEEGVAHAQEVAHLRSDIRRLRKELKALESTAFEGITNLAEFVALQVTESETELAEKATRCAQALDRTRQLASNLQVVRQRPQPVSVTVAEGLDVLLREINDCLVSSFEQAHREAVEAVERHILTSTANTTATKDWLKKGLSQVIQEHCPFCGQPLGGEARLLLDSYHSFFDEAFSRFAAGINEQITSFPKRLGLFVNPTVPELLEANARCAEEYRDVLDDTGYRESLLALSQAASALRQGWGVLQQALEDAADELNVRLAQKKDAVYASSPPWAPVVLQSAHSRFIDFHASYQAQLDNVVLPLRRVVTPENVANLVAFLVSPLAARITGVAVTIDAGELSMSDLV